MDRFCGVKRRLTSLSVLRNHSSEVYCAMVHAERALLTWVFLCLRACTGLAPAVARGGRPERVAWDFF